MAYDPSTYLLYLRMKSSFCFRSGPCKILDANLGGNYQDEAVETSLLVWYTVTMTPKLSRLFPPHSLLFSHIQPSQGISRKQNPTRMLSISSFCIFSIKAFKKLKNTVIIMSSSEPRSYFFNTTLQYLFLFKQ